MTKSALKMITDYLESQGKLVYAKNIDSMNSELAALRAQVEEKNKALEPFARFAKEMENMGGNFPKTGALYGLNVTPEGGGAEITVEDFKAALAAMDKG